MANEIRVYITADIKPGNNSFVKRRSLFICWLLLNVTYTCFGQNTTVFRVVKNIPIISASINGNPAYFIIDTGASVTILNATLCNTYNFKVLRNRYYVKYKIEGMGGIFSLKEVREAKVMLGMHEVNFINKAADLDRISDHFAEEDIIIAGIIGTDLLYFLGSKIDFNRKTIVFR